MADEKSSVGNMKESVPDRLLGAAETNMWFANRNATLNVCLASSLTGERVEAQQFSSAVHEVCQRSPILRCTIKTGPLRFIAESGSPQIWYESGNLSDRIDAHINTSFQEEQSLCRFELLQQSDDSQAIMLSFHHSIGDGISGSFIIKDLQQALNGRIFRTNTRLLPAWEDCLSTTIAGWQGIRGFAQTLRWIFRQLKPLGLSTPVVTVNDAEAGAKTAKHISILLDPVETRSLVDRSRNYGCTVHGLLTACIAEAFAPEMSAMTGGWTFVSPVDMRNRLDHDSYGFQDAVQFVNSAALTVVNPRKQTGQEMAVNASKQLKAFIGAGYSRYFAPYPSRLFLSTRLFPNNNTGIRRAGQYNKAVLKNTSVVLSNLGIIDQAGHDYDSKVRLGRVYFCSSPSIVADVVHFVATHAGMLTMMVCFNSPQITEERMARYEKRLRSALLGN
jgi:NRPS condensation-like uncharacterized protein